MSLEWKCQAKAKCHGKHKTIDKTFIGVLDNSYNLLPPKRITIITDNEIIDVADSELSIEYLSKRYNKDLNRNLTAQQGAVAHAMIKMTEESLLW
jgi:hypothetical protein